MEENQLEQYYATLKQLEENMQRMESSLVESFLKELFEIKPVRLKWYLVKAQLMLKDGEEIDKIVDFLIDKCDPWYDYESVDGYFELLSKLFELKGDLVESKRYLYQFNKLQEILHGVQGKNTVVDEKIASLTTQMKNEANIQQKDMLALAELYYVKGDIYLYLLWMVVAEQVFGGEQVKIRDWVLEKVNAGYYYERLMSEKEEVFVVMIASERKKTDCLLAERALKLLGKKVVLLKEAISWEKGNDMQEVVSASIHSIREEDSTYEADIYYLDDGEIQRDTRFEVLNYIAQNYSKEDLITVIGSGVLLDQIGMEKESKPRFERLTPADADYLEENIAVGRCGDYLGYIANIYKSSKQEIHEELYKKPSCRFSIIVPCRNAGNTLHYTLKTCLNQSFQGDYEIVVSDNSDMAWGMDTPTYRMCQEFHDDRIKYYRTPGNLSLMKNFEYGYLKARGEFLLSMGADDGILPWALEELDGVISEHPDIPIWLWHEVSYKWADTDKRFLMNGGKAKLEVWAEYKKGSPELMQYQTKDIFQRSFREYGMMYYLPQLYHNAGIHRGYLATLYEKTGVLWSGISQDICMAVTIGNIEEKVSFIQNILTIEALSSASIGVQCTVGNSDLQATDIAKAMRNTYAQGWRVQGYMERLCPTIGGFVNGLHACVLYAYSIGVISEEFLNEMDWRGMYERVSKEIGIDDILYDKKLHRLRYAASLHGQEMLDWFDDNIYCNCIQPRYVKNNSEQKDTTEKPYEESITIQGKTVKAEPNSIGDVYKVSLFLEKYFTGKNGNGECI